MRLQALLWVGSGSIGIGRVRSDLLDLRALGVGIPWDSRLGGLKGKTPQHVHDSPSGLAMHSLTTCAVVQHTESFCVDMSGPWSCVFACLLFCANRRCRPPL